MAWSSLFSLMLLVVIGVLCSVAEINGSTCSYKTRCTKIEKYTVKCGWLWKSRCARYRTKYDYCTKITSCITGSWTCGYCSRTCGGGYQSCSRSCTSLYPYCRTTEKTNKRCNTQRCVPVVNGGWSPWSSTSCGSCSKSCCQTGSRTCTRRRTCTNPPPRYGGRYCYGSSVSTYRQSCYSSTCTIHCTKAGALFPNPCQKCSATYYQCSRSYGTATRRTCPSGYFYNKYISRCDTNRNLYACNGVGWNLRISAASMSNVTQILVNVPKPEMNATQPEMIDQPELNVTQPEMIVQPEMNVTQPEIIDQPELNDTQPELNVTTADIS